MQHYHIFDAEIYRSEPLQKSEWIPSTSFQRFVFIVRSKPPQNGPVSCLRLGAAACGPLTSPAPSGWPHSSDDVTPLERNLNFAFEARRLYRHGQTSGSLVCLAWSRHLMISTHAYRALIRRSVDRTLCMGSRLCGAAKRRWSYYLPDPS